MKFRVSWEMFLAVLFIFAIRFMSIMFGDVATNVFAGVGMIVFFLASVYLPTKDICEVCETREMRTLTGRVLCECEEYEEGEV